MKSSLKLSSMGEDKSQAADLGALSPVEEYKLEVFLAISMTPVSVCAQQFLSHTLAHLA